MKRNTPEEDFTTSTNKFLATEIPNVCYPDDIWIAILSWVPFGYYPFIRTTSKTFKRITNTLGSIQEYQNLDGNSEEFLMKVETADPLEIDNFKSYEYMFNENQKIEKPRHVLPFYKASNFLSILVTCEHLKQILLPYDEKLCINNIVAHGDLDFLKKYFKVYYFNGYGVFATALAHGHNHILKWLIQISYDYSSSTDRAAILRYGSFSLNLAAYSKYGSHKIFLIPCLREERYELFEFLISLETADEVNVDIIKFRNCNRGFQTQGCLQLLSERGLYSTFYHLACNMRSLSKGPYGLDVYTFTECILNSLMNGHVDFATIMIDADFNHAIDTTLDPEMDPINLSSQLSGILIAHIFAGKISLENLLTIVKQLFFTRNSKKITLHGSEISKFVHYYGIEALSLFDKYFFYLPDSDVYDWFGVGMIGKFRGGKTPNPNAFLCIKGIYEKFAISPTYAQIRFCFEQNHKELFSWLLRNFDLVKICSQRVPPGSISEHLSLIFQQDYHDDTITNENHDEICTDFFVFVMENLLQLIPGFVIEFDDALRVLQMLDWCCMPKMTKKFFEYLKTEQIQKMWDHLVEYHNNEDMQKLFPSRDDMITKIIEIDHNTE